MQTALVCLADDQGQPSRGKVGVDHSGAPCGGSSRARSGVDAHPCAGLPLVSPSGDVLGSLCLPRQPADQRDPGQEHVLRVLAAQVVARLELRRQVAVQAVLADERDRALSALEESEQRCRSLFEQSPVGQVETDAEGRLLRANAAFSAIVGRPAADLAGLHLDDLSAGSGSSGRDSAGARDSTGARHSTGARRAMTGRVLVRPDGTHVQADLTTSVVRRADGGVAAVMGTVVDVTERNVARGELELLVGELREARDQAQERSQLLQAVLETSPVPLLRLELDGTVREVNPALRRLLARPSRLLVGRPAQELVHPADRALLTGALGGTDAQPVELRLLRVDGSPVWCELATTTGSGPGPVLAQLLDVDARKRKEHQLERAAEVDVLTGLDNRAVVDRELRRLLDPAVGRGACVLFVDLDGFKRVNDTSGHEAGDAVLVETAARLRAALRPGDTAARTGGDEFVVLCPVVAGHPAASAAAEALAGRLEEALSAPVLHAGTSVPAGASVGSAVGRPGEDPAVVLARADRAMYGRKGRRTSRRGERPEGGRRRGDGPGARLAGALEDGRLRLQYQPVVDLRTGAVVGAEALMRLVDQAGRDLPPERFLPVAEASGVIGPLGRWALACALEQVAGWAALSPDAPAFFVGVNVSPRQLEDPGLVAAVGQALADAGVPASQLVLEVTEGRPLPDTRVVRIGLAGLVDLGVRLALDDFGAGHAGPGSLADHPIAVVKVDRRFTARLDRSGPAGGLARGVFALARESGLMTVAEGVETAEQRDAALRAGCPLGQGYLFSRPLEPGALTALLARPRPLQRPVATSS